MYGDDSEFLRSFCSLLLLQQSGLYRWSNWNVPDWHTQGKEKERNSVRWGTRRSRSQFLFMKSHGDGRRSACQLTEVSYWNVPRQWTRQCPSPSPTQSLTVWCMGAGRGRDGHQKNRWLGHHLVNKGQTGQTTTTTSGGDGKKSSRFEFHLLLLAGPAGRI